MIVPKRCPSDPTKLQRCASDPTKLRRCDNEAVAGDDCDCPDDCNCNGAGIIVRATQYTDDGSHDDYEYVGTITAGTYCVKYEDGAILDSSGNPDTAAALEFFNAGTSVFTGQSTQPGFITTCFTFEGSVDMWVAHGVPGSTGLVNGGVGFRVCEITEVRVNLYPVWSSTGGVGNWSVPTFIGWSLTPDSTPLDEWVIDGETALYTGSPTFTCEDLADEPVDGPTVDPDGNPL